MSYTFTNFVIRSLDSSGANTRPDNLQYPPVNTCILGIGELIEVELSITKTAPPFVNGATYMLNFNLFAAMSAMAAIPQGVGWLLTVAGATATVQFIMPGFEGIQQNFMVHSVVVSASVMTIKFRFYATSDLYDFAKLNLSDNGLRWLTANLNGTFNAASGTNVYTGTSFLECSFYRCDPLTYLPTSPTDFAGSVFTAADRYFIKVAGKYYDHNINATQSWGPTRLNENGLILVQANAQTVTGNIVIKRRVRPFLDPQIDINFFYLPNQNTLIYNEINDITAAFNIQHPTYTKVEARLICLDNALNQGLQNFYAEYQADSINIPASDPTPAPNWLSGGAFGTPASWTVGVSSVVVNFKLDGAKLSIASRYRLMFILTDLATDFVSTHITPELICVEGLATLTGVTGYIAGYNNEYTGDDLEVSQLERIRCRIEIDETSYTGGVFATDLVSVAAQITPTGFLGASQQNALYLFQAAQSNSTPPVVFSQVGSILNFATTFRVPLHFNATNQDIRVLWSITVRQTTISGTNDITFTYEQYLRVKPIDTVRIQAIQPVEFPAFNPPLPTLCRADDFVGIEIAKNGPPDANIAALVLSLDQNPPSVEEEQSYPSPYLPQSFSPLLQGVETAFGDNIARYVLRTGLLPVTSPQAYFCGVILYDI